MTERRTGRGTHPKIGMNSIRTQSKTVEKRNRKVGGKLRNVSRRIDENEGMVKEGGRRKRVKITDCDRQWILWSHSKVGGSGSDDLGCCYREPRGTDNFRLFRTDERALVSLDRKEVTRGLFAQVWTPTWRDSERLEEKERERKTD